MVTYTPKTEEQLATESLLPEGIYDATCIETSDKPSKKGNDMITLKLQIFHEDGFRIVFDYIVFGNSFGERKFRHAANSFGLLAKYNLGKLNANDFQDKSCRVEIKQAKGNADYPNPKNVVSDYVGKDESVETKKVQKFNKPKQATASEMIDDGVPF